MQNKVLITEFMDEASVDALRREFAVDYEPGLVGQRAALLARVGEYPALIVRNATQVDQALLAAAPQLKVVGRLGVGLDNIDVASCAARRIEVIPATGANALSVAEYVITTALLLLRGAYHAHGAMAAGLWPRPALSKGREIAGKTLGLIGFGGIGRLTASLAQGLGMKVIANDPALPPDHEVWREHHVEQDRIEGVISRADVLSLHVPLVDATRNFIDATRLAAMKPGAVLINTARGGVVDEAALVAALQSGHLGGAALDVFLHEPLPEESPLARALKDGLGNLILTPHIAGVTTESNERVSQLIAEKVAQFLRTH